MLLYLFILFLLLGLSLINVDFIKGKQPLLLYALVIIFLLLLSGLRYKVGMDYDSYLEFYKDAEWNALTFKEPGFMLIAILFKYINIPFEGFIFFTATLTLLLVSKFIRDRSPFIFLSVMIFFSIGQFYFNTFNGIRQCIAIYFFYNMLPLILERKFFRYLIGLCLLTFFFHQTAILLLPLYFFIHKHINLKTKICIIVFLLFNCNLFSTLIGSSTYAVYLKFENFAAEVSLSTYLLLFFSLYFLLLESNSKRIFGSYQNIYYNINFFSVFTLLAVVQFSGSPLIMVFNRLSYNFTPILIILIPLYIAHFKLRSNKRLLSSLITCLLFIICFLALYINGNSNHLTPYKFIF